MNKNYNRDHADLYVVYCEWEGLEEITLLGLVESLMVWFPENWGSQLRAIKAGEKVMAPHNRLYFKID